MISALWHVPASPLFGPLVAAVHVILAISVTMNVLLKKSDVRGALGWIGLVWLAPLLGSAVYFLFGINRVSRRAARLRGPLMQAHRTKANKSAVPQNIRILSDVGDRVTGEPLTGGNRLDALQDGDQAYGAMLAAIADATQSIAMASYIFHNDAVGKKFADALIAARQRGVDVRVLLDSVGAGYLFTPILYRMRRGGVRAERFLHIWLPWRMPFLNMRNHRKILVIDGATAFVGGMNISQEACPSIAGDKTIKDMHFRVTGPVVQVVMDVFAQDWTFTTGESLDQDCWWPPLAPCGAVFARGLRSGPDADLYKLELILGAALNLARKRIRIVTPYFLPDARLQFLLHQAVLRGVTVEIVLPEKSDQPIMDWAIRGHLRFLRYIKARIIVSPQPFDHSKLCTVDGEWSLIGSSNWDARSFRLNFEFDLECADRALTAQIDAVIDTKIAAGRIIAPDAMMTDPLVFRLRDAAARLLMPYL